MKTRKLPSLSKISVLALFILAFTSHLSFSQWINPGTGSLSNLGQWPSTNIVDENIMFVVGGTTTGGPTIYRTVNGGTNFYALPLNGIEKNVAGQTYKRFFSTVYGKDSLNIFVGDAGFSQNGLINNVYFYKTTNGGKNWLKIDSSGTNVLGFFNGIVFSKSNPNMGIAHCDPNGLTGQFILWKTTNGGNTWTRSIVSQSENSYGAQNSVFMVDQNFFGFGLSESTARVAVTTNGGTNWTYSALPGATSSQGFVCTVSFNEDKLHGYAGVNSTNDSIWKTSNGGVNWYKIGIPGIPNNASGQANVKYIYGTHNAFYVVSNSSTTYTYKLKEFGTSIEPYPSTTSITNILHIDAFYNSAKAVGDATLVSISSSGNIRKFQDSPLPVELASFTYNVAGRDVNLKWITANEQNNAGFEIYKINSDLDKSNILNWNKIGFKEGKGTTNNPTEYNFTEKNVNTGKYYYKIKQIDYNGNYEFFELNGMVSIGTPNKVTLNQNYPNPFNPVTNISYELPSNSMVTLKIYDMTGREVSNLLNQNQNAGYHTVKFNASTLASGIYFYKLTITNENNLKSEYTKTMSVVK